MKFPKVFVIILNYNGQKVLRNCLDSLYRDDYPNKEVVVVDNASEDDSFDKMRVIFSKYNFIKNDKNLGFAGGNNVAIKWALEKMADYVFLLNNDAVLGENAIRIMIEEAEKDQKTGIFSPIIYDKNGQIWFSGGKINWLKMRAEHQEDIKKTEFVTGCAMLIRKEVFKKIGLLDEKFFLYYEDTDFSYRADKAGFGLRILKNSRVDHLEESQSNPQKNYYLVLSGIRFFRKNAGFWKRFYLEGYLLGRKIKNYIDLRKNPADKDKQLVRKAYRDGGFFSLPR
ncbi:MAG: glycosyltransferase family 2 protein [Candidatus Moraniibacteriota bacterium]